MKRKPAAPGPIARYWWLGLLALAVPVAVAGVVALAWFSASHPRQAGPSGPGPDPASLDATVSWLKGEVSELEKLERQKNSTAVNRKGAEILERLRAAEGSQVAWRLQVESVDGTYIHFRSYRLGTDFDYNTGRDRRVELVVTATPGPAVPPDFRDGNGPAFGTLPVGARDVSRLKSGDTLTVHGTLAPTVISTSPRNTHLYYNLILTNARAD